MQQMHQQLGSLKISADFFLVKLDVPGSKHPLFPYNRDGHQPNSVGVYIPIIRVPIRPSPKKRNF